VSEKIDCANCSKIVCDSKLSLEGPSNCPTKIKSETIKHALAEYDHAEVKEFAQQASIQEYEGYMQLPEGLTPRNTRVEEVIQFSKKMGYKKLGVAFCNGLRNEAKTLVKILENRGFNVVSVCCKVGGIPKETLGLTGGQKLRGPSSFESMCNPIAQAEILNSEKVEFNIVVGLCVGHDSLFFRYAHAPVTVLVAKDRVLAHNPAAGLYQAGAYYSKLLHKESLDSQHSQ